MDTKNIIWPRHLKKSGLFLPILLGLLLGVGAPLSALAAPGDLDTTFSGDGKQTTDFFGHLDGANGMTLQSDGKIIAVGYTADVTAGLYYDIAVARYNTNGSLDPNFDGDGRVITDFQGFDDLGAAVSMSGTKILVAGAASATASNYDFALVRYMPDGSLDTSFNGGGKVLTDIMGDDQAIDMAVLSDGKILLAGASNLSGSNDFSLVKYNSDGTLDSTFGVGGKVITDFGGSDAIFDVAVQSDGKIVAAGFAGPSGLHDFAVARYEPNGILDTSFSIDGKATVDFVSGDDLGLGMLIQPNGRIVVVGVAGFATQNFGIARFLSDGTLDTNFGGNGRVNTDFGDDEYAYDVLQQPDNKLVVVGGSQANEFVLARYLQGGALDTTFSGDGKVNTPFGEASSSALQPDGKIVAVGSTADDFALARYLNDTFATVTPTASATTTRTGTPTTTRTSTPTGTAASTTTPTNTQTATTTSTPLPTQTPGGPTATDTPTATNTSISTPTTASTVTVTPTNPTGETATPTTPPGGTSTPTACPVQFADVPAGNTFYSNVRCLACRGIISGYACGGAGEPCNGNNEPYFRPGNLVTRGQIAKIAANSAGFIEPVSGQTFEDVPSGSTFYEFVERLIARGVMNGYACGGAGEPCVAPGNRPYFRPNATATRGQLAKITANAANFTEPVSGQTFEDVAVGSTFYEFVERLASRSAMSGYACGGGGEPCVPPNNLPYFRPNSNVTRGQTSKIVGNSFFPGCDPPGRILMKVK